MSQPQEYEQVTYNSNDGAQIARTSTDLVSFYGVVPSVKVATWSTSAVSTSTATTSTVVVGFTSAAEMQNLVIAVSTMQYALKTLGIIS